MLGFLPSDESLSGNALYKTIGTTLKHVFTGYHAWIIGYTDEYFSQIGLAPSQKVELNNGGLDRRFLHSPWQSRWLWGKYLHR